MAATEAQLFAQLSHLAALGRPKQVSVELFILFFFCFGFGFFRVFLLCSTTTTSHPLLNIYFIFFFEAQYPTVRAEIATPGEKHPFRRKPPSKWQPETLGNMRWADGQTHQGVCGNGDLFGGGEFVSQKTRNGVTLAIPNVDAPFQVFNGCIVAGAQTDMQHAIVIVLQVAGWLLLFAKGGEAARRRKETAFSVLHRFSNHFPLPPPPPSAPTEVTMWHCAACAFFLIACFVAATTCCCCALSMLLHSHLLSRCCSSSYLWWHHHHSREEEWQFIRISVYFSSLFILYF